MKDYVTKVRHILPVFIIVTIGTVAGLLLIRYLAEIKFELLELKLDIWEIWIPLIFPWIPITIWLRPRFRILHFRKYKENRQSFFQFLSWGTMLAPMMVSQMYLTTASGEIQDVGQISDLDKTEIARYYRVGNFNVLPSFGSSHADFRSSGKYNQHLDIKVYFVCPIAKDSLLAERDKFRFWYGVSFKKQISNRLSPQVKEREYRVFFEECLKKMNAFDFHNLSYFERIPNTRDRDNYLQAVRMRLEDAEGVAIFEPRHGSFEDRNGSKAFWIPGSYAIGMSVLLLFLLWPGVDKRELSRQLAGRKPKADDVVEMFRFLIPKYPHFATSVIVDVNVIVFLAMAFSGIHLLSPNGLELLAWGANRRTEVLNGEWWRLATNLFVHGGVMHLFMNMYGLVLAALFIEPLIGARRFSIIYVLSGLAGSIASICWYENIASVGASGAIFGLFGTILILSVFGVFDRNFMLTMFGPYVAISLLAGLVGGIDNAAHIGGLVTGATCGLIMRPFFRQPQLKKRRKRSKAVEKTSH